MEEEVLHQYAHQIDPIALAQTFRVLGLTLSMNMDGTRAGKILLPAIEETLERVPEHTFQHWGNRGWWYHGTLAEQEWVLLRLKFFN